MKYYFVKLCVFIIEVYKKQAVWKSQLSNLKEIMTQKLLKLGREVDIQIREAFPNWKTLSIESSFTTHYKLVLKRQHKRILKKISPRRQCLQLSKDWAAQSLWLGNSWVVGWNT